MKKLKYALMVLAVSGFAAVAAPAHAEVKIAVVDVERLLTDSKAGQDIRKQIEARREGFQKELAGQEKTLATEQDALLKMQKDGKNTSDDFKKKAAAFEKKVNEAQKLLQDRRSELEKAAVLATNELRTKALESIGEITSKEKYDIVLTKQNVILASETMDITDESLKVLDGKISKVVLKSGK